MYRQKIWTVCYKNQDR